jgi:hypothetical protein
LALHEAQFARPNNGDTSRVISSVLKPTQSLHEDRNSVPLADITYDPAHVLVSSPID